MTKEFFNEIIDRIKTEFPTFKKVGMYNNQFGLMDDGSIDSFQFPACFVSVPETVIYENRAGGNQNTLEFTLRFYIGSKLLVDDNLLDVFDLKQSFYNVMHLYKPANASTLIRYAEQPDENRKGVYIFIQDYKVSLIDSSKFVTNGMIQITGVELETESDIIINPLTVGGIRTQNQGNFNE